MSYAFCSKLIFFFIEPLLYLENHLCNQIEFWTLFLDKLFKIVLDWSLILFVKFLIVQLIFSRITAVSTIFKSEKKSLRYVIIILSPETFSKSRLSAILDNSGHLFW